MKQTLLIVFLCVASLAAISQPLLNSSYNPTVGTTTNTVVCDPTAINPGPSGAAQIWTFNLNPTGPVETLSYVDPSSTAAGGSFPTATVAYQDNPSINLFGYYEANGSEMTYLGSGSDIEVLAYDNPITNLVYPFAFGDSLVDTYGFDNGISSLSGVQHVYYDGYGTLVINGHTYNNVIRIRNVKDDTTTFDLAIIPFHGEYYQWIDPSMPGQVLLHITLSPGFSFVRAIDEAVGVNETLNPILFNVFPTVSGGDGFVITYQLEYARELHVSMYDALGRMVDSKTLEATQRGETRIETAGLARGLYVIQLKDANGLATTRRVVIQ